MCYATPKISNHEKKEARRKFVLTTGEAETKYSLGPINLIVIRYSLSPESRFAPTN